MAAGDLLFREATAADVEAAAEVFVACFSRPPWSEPWSHGAAVRRLKMFAAAPSFRGAVAIEEGRVVALALGQLEGWTEGNLFLLQELCVLPERQRAGIGERLLAHLLSELRRRDDVVRAYLLTDAGGAAESHFLGRGFRRSDRRVVLSRAVVG
ncbi:MAG TPA: GNAT family N-acetyltransferase [Polyangia bacterium]|nr:GNAT family N-acetyltransferase [Polyangia bacterium]